MIADHAAINDKACSGFTHVTARRIAQPPKAAFVTRLQPCRLPGRTARQLPDQSTTLWVESSSTSDSRLRGALPNPDIRKVQQGRPSDVDGAKKVLCRWRDSANFGFCLVVSALRCVSTRAHQIRS